MLNMVNEQKFPPCPAVELEIELIKSEVRAVLNKVFELGNGDIARGTVLAFEAGVLDVPFAPAACNAGKILPVRDNTARYAYWKPEPFHCQKIFSTSTTITLRNAHALKDANRHSRWL